MNYQDLFNENLSDSYIGVENYLCNTKPFIDNAFSLYVFKNWGKFDLVLLNSGSILNLTLLGNIRDSFNVLVI